jgi:hypothetical protein
MHGDLWNLRDLTNYISCCKLYMIYIYIYLCILYVFVDHVIETTEMT